MPQNGLQFLLMIPTTLPVGLRAASAASIFNCSDTGTQRSIRYCSYKGQKGAVIPLQSKVQALFLCITAPRYCPIYNNKQLAEFHSDYKRGNNIHLPPTVSRGKANLIKIQNPNSPLSPPPLLQHHHPLLRLHPAARLKRAPPTGSVATAARQPHPGSPLC